MEVSVARLTGDAKAHAVDRTECRAFAGFIGSNNDIDTSRLGTEINLLIGEVAKRFEVE